ncbi:MAG: hypothetical protein GY828_05955 [Candidatus Gracilibacteria bacterium]|nr:hypothetical protein [Candidatus Gracilibacteria bacterium]
MKKNATTRIIASLAFFGIIISIIGSGLLIIFSNNAPSQDYTPERTYTAEEIEELKKQFDTLSGSLITSSGAIETLSGSDNQISEVLDKTETLEANPE